MVRIIAHLGHKLSGNTMPSGIRLWVTNALMVFARERIYFSETGLSTVDHSRVNFKPFGVHRLKYTNDEKVETFEFTQEITVRLWPFTSHRASTCQVTIPK